MAKYHAGRGLEYEIKALFTAAGWDSIRGAGSKGSVDGFKTDLVFSKRSAHNERLIYLVLMQAKRKALTKKEKVQP